MLRHWTITTLLFVWAFAAATPAIMGTSEVRSEDGITFNIITGEKTPGNVDGWQRFAYGLVRLIPAKTNDDGNRVKVLNATAPPEIWPETEVWLEINVGGKISRLEVGKGFKELKTTGDILCLYRERYGEKFEWTKCYRSDKSGKAKEIIHFIGRISSFSHNGRFIAIDASRAMQEPGDAGFYVIDITKIGVPNQKPMLNVSFHYPELCYNQVDNPLEFIPVEATFSPAGKMAVKYGCFLGKYSGYKTCIWKNFEDRNCQQIKGYDVFYPSLVLKNVNGLNGGTDIGVWLDPEWTKLKWLHNPGGLGDIQDALLSQDSKYLALWGNVCDKTKKQNACHKA